MLCNIIPEYSHFLPINPIFDAILMYQNYLTCQRGRSFRRKTYEDLILPLMLLLDRIEISTRKYVARNAETC